jgi:hypothetical protein
MRAYVIDALNNPIGITKKAWCSSAPRMEQCASRLQHMVYANNDWRVIMNNTDEVLAMIDTIVSQMDDLNAAMQRLIGE